MTDTIRVLVADNSMIIRRLLSESLGVDAKLQVVGMARHRAELLKLLPVTSPDVILLDVEMEVMDGVETIAAILPLSHIADEITRRARPVTKHRVAATDPIQ